MLVVSLLAAASQGQNGLTLNTYTNMGLHGTPASSTVVDTPSFSHSGTKTKDPNLQVATLAGTSQRALLRLQVHPAFICHLGGARTCCRPVAYSLTLPSPFPPFLPSSFSPGAEPFSAELVGSIAFPVHGGVYHFDCNWTEATMGYVWVDGHMICQDAHTYKPGAGTTVRHRIRYTKAAAMQKSRSLKPADAIVCMRRGFASDAALGICSTFNNIIEKHCLLHSPHFYAYS